MKRTFDPDLIARLQAARPRQAHRRLSALPWLTAVRRRPAVAPLGVMEHIRKRDRVGPRG